MDSRTDPKKPTVTWSPELETDSVASTDPNDRDDFKFRRLIFLLSGIASTVLERRVTEKTVINSNTVLDFMVIYLVN